MIEHLADKKILVVDLETSPLVVYTFKLGENHIGPNQVIEHPFIMSATCKWVGQDEVMYKDQRNAPDMKNDKELTEWIRELFQEANIVVGQHSKAFDVKYVQARIEFHKLLRPTDFRQQDTREIAKRMFKLPSYSLAYMSEYFDLKYKKLDHGKFPGLSLWTECLGGNPEAWDEMETYNKHDVLGTEELYLRLIKWDDKVTFHSMDEDHIPKCDSCGTFNLTKNGFRYKNGGQFQRYQCHDCGKPVVCGPNLLSKAKKAEMPKGG